MKHLIITRPKERTNRYYPYKIVTPQNQLIAEIANNDTVELDVDESIPYIKAKLSYGGSNKLALSDCNEVQKIEVKSHAFFFTTLTLSGSFIILAYTLRYIYDSLIIKNISNILLIGILLFITLSATLWKNKWIEMRKAE